MFNSKIFNIFAMWIILFMIPKKEVFNIKTKPANIQINNVGAVTTINNSEISVNFFGYDNMPNENTVWRQEVSNDSCLLEYINKDNIKFMIKWDLKNPHQPKLEIFVTNNKGQISLRHEIKIKNLKPKDSTVKSRLNNQEKTYYHPIPLSTYINQKGWIALQENNSIFAVKIDNEKFEIDENIIQIFKEHLNTRFVASHQTFHSSNNNYFILKNQNEFENLEDMIDFGYYMHSISKNTYILFKNFEDFTKSTLIGLLLITLLLFLFGIPFFIDSIKMQQLTVKMQPEIDTINNCDLDFSEKQRMINEVHARYGYSQFTHLFAQILLIVFLTIFQNISSGSDLCNLMLETQFITYAVIALLCITVVTYNLIIYQNKQVYITALFTLLFASYPKLPLIGFIIIHWLNLVFFYIYSLKYGKNNQ